MAEELPCVLVVDDEPDMREILTRILEKEGFRIIEAPDGDRALYQVRFGSPDAVLLDVHMPGLNGMDVLKKIREGGDDLPVVLVTAFAEIHEAVEAVKEGAYDYLAKPFENSEVVRVTRRAISEGRLRKQLRSLTAKTHGISALLEKMGPSDAVARLASEVHRVAQSDYSVVITGETGSGKELVARAIHADSARSNAPFVAIDCGAIPEPLLETELFGHEKGSFTGAERQKIGKFQLAEGGTLFMDELANLPSGSQSKFLRVMQDQLFYRVGGTVPVQTNVRFVFATNSDLEGLVASGDFRSDLYWRLSEFMIVLPPLRERAEDIPYLAKRFLDAAAIELNKTLSGFTDEAVAALTSHSWPGNVRQMRSAIRRAALIAKGAITKKDLGLTLALTYKIRATTVVEGASWENASLREIVQRSVFAVERAVLTEVLKFTAGNKARAARLLKVDYKTMHTKVKKYDIQTKGGEGDKA